MDRPTLKLLKILISKTSLPFEHVVILTKIASPKFLMPGALIVIVLQDVCTTKET